MKVLDGTHQKSWATIRFTPTALDRKCLPIRLGRTTDLRVGMIALQSTTDGMPRFPKTRPFCSCTLNVSEPERLLVDDKPQVVHSHNSPLPLVLGAAGDAGFAHPRTME